MRFILFLNLIFLLISFSYNAKFKLEKISKENKYFVEGYIRTTGRNKLSRNVAYLCHQNLNESIVNKLCDKVGYKALTSFYTSKHRRGSCKIFLEKSKKCCEL